MTKIVGLPVYGYHCSFRYKNWRGEIAQRRVEVISVWYGVTEYHTTPQWLLNGLDLDKKERRDFAMADMTEIEIKAD